MNQRTENRIWRGLGLAAVAGLFIAASSKSAQNTRPKPVQFQALDYTFLCDSRFRMFCDDGSIWVDKPYLWSEDGKVMARRWVPSMFGPTDYPDTWATDWVRPSGWEETYKPDPEKCN